MAKMSSAKVKTIKGPSKARVPSIMGAMKSKTVAPPQVPMGATSQVSPASPFGMKKGGVVKKNKKNDGDADDAGMKKGGMVKGKKAKKK